MAFGEHDCGKHAPKVNVKSFESGLKPIKKFGLIASAFGHNTNSGDARKPIYAGITARVSTFLGGSSWSSLAVSAVKQYWLLYFLSLRRTFKHSENDPSPKRLPCNMPDGIFPHASTTDQFSREKRTVIGHSTKLGNLAQKCQKIRKLRSN